MSSFFSRTGTFRAPKLYNLVVLIESIILFVCSIYGFIKFNFNESIISMTLLVGVYINIYLLFFSISALKREDAVQLLLSSITHVFLTIISTIHYFQQPASHPFNTALLIIFITTVVSQVLYLFLTPASIHSFGMYIFEKIGGDSHMQKLYKQGLIFFAALKFDIFLSMLAVLLASARLIDNFKAKENILNIICCIWNLIWIFTGYHIVKFEHRRSLIIWSIFGCIGQPFYIIFKSYQLWSNGFYSQDYPHDAKVIFMVVSSIWLFVRVFLILWTLIVIRTNFGQGLIEIWANTLRSTNRDELELKKQQQKAQIEAMKEKALLQKQKDLYGSGFQYGAIGEINNNNNNNNKNGMQLSSRTTTSSSSSNDDNNYHHQQQRSSSPTSIKPSVNNNNKGIDTIMEPLLNNDDGASDDIHNQQTIFISQPDDSNNNNDTIIDIEPTSNQPQQQPQQQQQQQDQQQQRQIQKNKKSQKSKPTIPIQSQSDINNDNTNNNDDDYIKNGDLQHSSSVLQHLQNNQQIGMKQVNTNGRKFR